ncbi:MAG: monovalent cation:proton antiporter-2 (CPA2) family protein [Betaproteobacteria bacterium]
MHDTLQLPLILLAAAVLVVVVCRQLKLPPLLGYLLVGIAIGPNALGWLPDDEGTRNLAEFGVVFLMFSIGLEFSLSKLATMRSLVFGLGAAQVVATLVTVLLCAELVGLDWKSGFALGGAIAMSSTAILGKLLAERLELNAPHGRQIMGVLLFQDLAVVPLLIVLPTLATPGAEMAVALGVAAVKAALVLSLLLGIGPKLMRPWFHLVASRRSSELFVLNVLLITLLLAWLTDLAGLSLALGAFIAGMLISETEYRFQVEEDIKPFRDVLLGLFFVTVGMLLDLEVVLEHAPIVAGLLIAMLAGKAALVLLIARVMRIDSGTALRTGLALAGAGEFGFVLLARAGDLGVLAPETLQPALAAMVLSMIASPFIVEESEHMVRRWIGSEWMHQAMALHNIAVQTMGATEHVIICGYGRSGQNLARILEQESIRFIALDLDPQRIREAAIAGESVVFGDAARRDVLVAAGLLRASAVVVSYADTHSALRIMATVQDARPGLPVIVRTRDDSDIDRLKEAGAAEVVAEIMEGSLMLASHALMLLGVPFHRVLKRIQQTREQRYSVFRGFFRGVTDEAGADTDDEPLRLHSVRLPPGAGAIGRALAELDLPESRVEVTAIRRRNIRSLAPTPDTQLAEGDVVVLRGRESDLMRAEMRLLEG